jgi:predicted acylesterase/phospholipase RssA
MTIKHLVISGGGPSGLLSYGVVSQLHKKGFWKLENIKSMYGCSIGAYISFILSLGYDWDWLDDYFIKRPWDKVVAGCMTRLTEIYEKKCLINDQCFIEAIRPLLRGKDLIDTITLAEFYAYNNIDLHMYSTNINTVKLEKLDISHKTHPNLSLIKALSMTMAFPTLFEPIFVENGCYIDGGLINNYPLNDCIEDQQCDRDEILGLKNIWQKNITQPINEKSSIFDFLIEIIKKAQASIDTEPEQTDIKYTVNCLMEDLEDFGKWADALNSGDKRKSIIEKGRNQADLFLAYLSKK